MRDDQGYREFARSQSLEVIPDALYDIRLIELGAEAVNFFGRAYGDEKGTTIEDTNMAMPSCLPPPRRFLVESIRVAPSPWREFVDRGAVGELWCTGSLQFFIGNKVYVTHAPIGEFMSEQGRKYDPAFLIEANQGFSVQLRFKHPHFLHKALKVGVYLEGKTVRPTE